MFNDRLDQLTDYPFERLTGLLGDISPPDGREPLITSIGEPQHPPPPLVADVLAANGHLWSKYPPTKGTPEFRATVADWLTRRYRLPDGMIEGEHHVLPVAGTREALFAIALAVVPPAKRGRQPTVLIPDPFYQVYAGAAVIAGAQPVFVPTTAATGFVPDFAALPDDVLDRAALAYLCSPSNPQGAVADRETMAAIANLARDRGFVLAVDECYCEIYDRQPPTGILEVVAADGGDFNHVIAFHSLSKRSNVPGLRSGFVAGGADLISTFARLRGYTGGVTPLPILKVAEALWRDEEHVEANRALYRHKFDLAAQVLGDRFGFYRPDGGFYLWLDVGDGEAAARKLWAESALKVMPGAYLSRAGDDSPGAPYIRVALVHERAMASDAIERLSATL